jgi:signal recognition particle subunit SEC65
MSTEKLNSWGEYIPKDINILLEKSHEIANVLQTKLQANNCPTLDDLYKRKSRIERQKNVFESLGYKPSFEQKDNPKNKNEFKGLYLFGEEIDGVITPVYIGISRTIYRRLRQHGFGKRHNECTLAYNIAKQKINFKKERKDFCEKLLFEERDKMLKFKVALFEVEEDYNLYFHEIAIAGILKTKYNTFKTH